MRIAIIGSSEFISTPDQKKIAFNLGFKLIESGFSIINGGMDGIMEATAKGARSSTRFKSDSVIGILRTENPKFGNDYSSIKLVTDMGTARNRLIILNSDAVVAIGGGSGTLNEISLAWEFDKPIVGFTNLGGWASKIANTQLDTRRKDKIMAVESVDDVLDWLNTIKS